MTLQKSRSLAPATCDCETLREEFFFCEQPSTSNAGGKQGRQTLARLESSRGEERFFLFLDTSFRLPSLELDNEVAVVVFRGLPSIART